MARCKYFYNSLDAAVISGEKQDGEQCKSNFANERWGWYCLPHSRKLGITAKDPEHAAKMREGRRIANEKRRNLGVSEDGVPKIVTDDLNEFNLQLVYDAFKLGNDKEKNQDRAIEKYCYAAWLEAENRNPTTEARVSRVLGISIQQLNIWKNSPIIQKYREKVKMDNLHKDMDFLCLRAIRTALEERNDAKAVELYQKYYKPDIAKVKTPDEIIPDSVWEEAQRRVPEGKRIHLLGTAAKLKTKLEQEAFLAGNVSPNTPEIEQ